ncbi:hypothetical protein GGX14DRAFT_467533 [Mycena pura]|uniref:Uncharacterized protein n=1 Tax=Mycena pura TaxID=153505 RepID=A0AAD6V592_9AGAR|nr:hypothetical protein GGX14DRAFT_467533 [Mycena pura]
MSLDDPNVLAGLASDGVPFFSGAAAGAGAGQTPHLDKRMPLGAPGGGMVYATYGGAGAGQGQGLPGPGAGAQTPGTREAESRELREFWKAYMRTPLTGPGAGGADPLGLQTPSASAAAAGAGAGGGGGGGGGGGNGNGNGGRRYRVASLPSARTPEGEMGAAPVFPVHHLLPPPPQAAAPGAGPRTTHNADDLRSYQAAVLARKTPELVLMKRGRRPTTSGGVPDQMQPGQVHLMGRHGHQQQQHQQQQQQQQHQQHQQHQQQPRTFDFNAISRERSGDAVRSSSLAGAFGFSGPGYSGASATSASHPSPSAAGTGSGSGPDSPFPATPGSTSTSASASEDGDHGDGGGDDDDSARGRPNFKRLPSQTLGPPQSKRRRDRPVELLLEPASAVAAHAQRRARRLSAPASPTAPAFSAN